MCSLKCSSATELGALEQSDDTGRAISDGSAFPPLKKKISIIFGLNGNGKGGHQLNEISSRFADPVCKGTPGKVIKLKKVGKHIGPSWTHFPGEVQMNFVACSK